MMLIINLMIKKVGKDDDPDDDKSNDEGDDDEGDDDPNDNNSGDDTGDMQIFVQIGSNTITMDVENTFTIKNIKAIIMNKEGIPTKHQRLLFNDLQPEDGCTLSYYDIQNESELNLLLSIKGGGKRPKPMASDAEKVERPALRLTGEATLEQLQMKRWLHSLPRSGSDRTSPNSSDRTPTSSKRRSTKGPSTS